MATALQLAARPGPTADPADQSRYRRVGFALAAVGLMGAMAAAIANFVAAGNIDATTSYAETLAWTFGVSIFSFGVLKLAVAAILMGIVVRLWFRVDAITASLRRLRGDPDPSVTTPLGDIDTEWGPATVTAAPAKLLGIHRLARFMWLPSLAMGTMALTAGLISSFVWADQTPGTESARQAAAFTQGIEFLGETFLLTGIAFLLGVILAGLREGGGEVQSSLGLRVTTLKMPFTAKAFIGLMAVGMMLGIAQFIGYLVAIGRADDPASFSTYLNVLGPLREVALGLILAGIVLALITIGNVLKFQFNRVSTIIRTGQ